MDEDLRLIIIDKTNARLVEENHLKNKLQYYTDTYGRIRNNSYTGKFSAKKLQKLSEQKIFTENELERVHQEIYKLQNIFHPNHKQYLTELRQELEDAQIQRQQLFEIKKIKTQEKVAEQQAENEKKRKLNKEKEKEREERNRRRGKGRGRGGRRGRSRGRGGGSRGRNARYN